MRKTRLFTIGIYAISSILILLSMFLQEFNIDMSAIHNSYLRPSLILILCLVALFVLLSRQSPKPIILFTTTALLFYAFADFLDFTYHNIYTEWFIMLYFVSAIFYLLILFSNIRHYNMNEAAVTKKKAFYYICSSVILPLLLVYVIDFGRDNNIYMSIYSWIVFSLCFYTYRCYKLGIRHSEWLMLASVLWLISHSILFLHIFKNLAFPFINSLIFSLSLISQTSLIYGITRLYQAKREID